MQSINFKSIVLIISTILLVYGEQNGYEQWTIEAGVTSHALNNKLSGLLKFPTVGLHVTFPVGIQNASVEFGAEYGNLSKTDKTISTNILFSNITLQYQVKLTDFFYLTPSIKLVNCALHLQPSENVNDFVIIATWENEFGAGAGCDLAFRYKKCLISVPVSVASVFTGDPAYVFSCGLRIGVLLQKKGNNES
jgi:hypothetical protein